MLLPDSLCCCCPDWSCHELNLLLLNPPSKAFITFFCAGLISCDPFHMAMPPLRSALLLLLVRLPLPHLPNLWRAAAAALTAALTGRRHLVPTESRASSSSSVPAVRITEQQMTREKAVPLAAPLQQQQTAAAAAGCGGIILVSGGSSQALGRQ
jgi:hypothetical protein